MNDQKQLSKKQKKKSLLNNESVAGYVFSAPFIIGFLFFVLVPVALSFYYSLCKYNIIKPAKFIGLQNYVKILQDETFLQTLTVTLKYVLFSVPVKLVFALLVALLLLKNTKLTPFYRATYYLPSILGASVAVAVLWKRMFAQDGLINQILGIKFAWLGDTRTALGVIILLSVWQFGSSMLIFLSALKQIPSDLYEAARVDGAGKISCFFRITLPLLTPTVFFNLVMQSINAFMVFAQGQIITNGKPLNSTLFYVVNMYQQAFEFNKVGYASALGWILLIVVALYTALLFRTKKYWVYDE